MIKTIAVATLALVATSGLASARTIHTTPDAAIELHQSNAVNLRHSYNLYAPGQRVAPRGSLASREFHDVPTNNLDD